jgi:Ca2+-binding RTX toxin-like protein
LLGIVSDKEGAEGIDKAYGGKGKDTILGSNDADFLLIFGGPDDDALSSDGEGGGRIYGGSGNDRIGAGGDLPVRFDAWGGTGDDVIGGNSEGTLRRAFGGSGNDEISTASFVKGGSGNDVIRFNDNCCVAFGDSGHDEIRGGDWY